MLKKLLTKAIALLVIVFVCIAVIPPPNVSASFKNGDVVVITDSVSGAIFPEGSPLTEGEDVIMYYLSAMDATNSEKTADYYAWCASYGVDTPGAGIEYVLYDHENAGKTTYNGKRYNLVNYDEETDSYQYFDTGLGDYIDFSWAISCIKAAEYYAGTTELSAGWRMIVELAIRQQFFEDVKNGDVYVSKSKAIYGNGVKDALNNAFGKSEFQGGTGVSKFFTSVNKVITYAEEHPVTWTPHTEQLERHTIIENKYYGDDFIFYQGVINKMGCEMEFATSHPESVTATFEHNVLTVKMPRKDMVNDVKYTWNATFTLPAGLNYNMMYGVPKEQDSKKPVQNIMVYEVNNNILTLDIPGDYTPHETADVTIMKTDENGSFLSGVEFTLYTINDDGSISELNHKDFPATIKTNDFGVAFWQRLKLGKYFLVESGKLQGYSDPTWKLKNVYSEGYDVGETGYVSAETVTKYTSDGTAKEGIIIDISEGGTLEASIRAVNEKLPTLSLSKVDRNENPIENIKFSLYKETDGKLSLIDTFSTDENGKIDFGALAKGNYFVTEESNGKWKPYKAEEWRVSFVSSATYTTLEGKSGWLVSLDVGNNGLIEAVNDYPVSIKLLKQNSKGENLKGATFMLEVSSDGGKTFTVADSKTTSDDGTVIFEDLDRFAYYRITETKAPDGYSLMKDPIFQGEIIIDTLTLIVNDSHTITLPQTGGNGTFLVSLATVISIICSLWLLIKAKKDKKIN